MAIKQITVACYSDVFDFANEKFKIHWNECCDLFHRSEYFSYRGNTEFYLEEVEGDFNDPETFYDKRRKQNEIMLAFMKENKLDKITITGA